MCYAVIQSSEDSYSLNLALFWRAEGIAYLQFSNTKQHGQWVSMKRRTHWWNVLTLCSILTDFCNLSTASTCSSGPVLVNNDKIFKLCEWAELCGDILTIQALNLLQERHQWSFCAVAFLSILQYPVSSQEDQVGFVFLSFFSSQELYYLKFRLSTRHTMSNLGVPQGILIILLMCKVMCVHFEDFISLIKMRHILSAGVSACMF